MDAENKHSVYDGIVEHDNPMPTWWLWTFFLTIIFSFIYYIHYELAGGPTLQDELRIEMAQIEKSVASKPAPVETEESLAAVFASAEAIQLGAASYAQKCASCHGVELQGLIGPNLVDAYWIHGKATRMDILHWVRVGVPEKGMPPWGPVMKNEELHAVSAYIYSKKGSKPSQSKEAQGELIEGYN